MSNVSTTYQLACTVAYNRDGYQDANADLRRTAGRSQHFADDLTAVTTTVANGTAAATVISTRATKVFEIAVEATGSAGFLMLYNAVAATVGVTAVHMAIPFPANETTVYRVFPGSNATGMFSTGICAGTATLVATSTAIGTAPTKIMFLLSTAP